MPRSTSKSSPEGSSKSLTPQRKHRKLLKDGTSEVWPESLEQIFVDGLRQYWESPWATYSRGRSRWRNQFLVDYLQKAGIERSKKQVASHIQVLRNMWKGEPEFHLVAGGEELFLETGLLGPVKAEESCDTSSLIPFDESDGLSPVTPSTPGFSPTEFIYEPGSDVPQSTLYSSSAAFPKKPLPSTHPFGIEQDTSFLSSPQSPQQPFHEHPTGPPTSSPTPQLNSRHDSYSVRTPSPPSTAQYHLQSDAIPVPSPSFSPPPTHSNNFQSLARHPDNRICFLSLWADGMQPFTVPTLYPSSAPPAGPSPSVTIRIRLRLSSIDDIHSPPTFHGFHGAVTLAAPWTSTAQCITKVYPNNICVAEETGPLQLLSTHSHHAGSNQTIQAFLPESPLSRSRWLDATVQTMISQQLIVDDVTLALFIYDLDRRDVGSPSADLLGIQGYHHQQDPNGVSRPSSRYTTNHNHPPFVPPLSRRTEQTSLSCALTPVNANNLRPPAMSTSLLY